jgi:hypothetical protein
MAKIRQIGNWRRGMAVKKRVNNRKKPVRVCKGVKRKRLPLTKAQVTRLLKAVVNRFKGVERARRLAGIVLKNDRFFDLRQRRRTILNQALKLNGEGAFDTDNATSTIRLVEQLFKEAKINLPIR